MNKHVSLAQMLPLIQEKLNNGGEVKFTVTGNSMMPILRHQKDQVILKKHKGRLQRYDLPLYQRNNGEFVLHRVIHVYNNSYSMCGDNQTILEHGIKDEMIIGIVTEIIRDGKQISCKNKKYLFYVFKRCHSRIIRH